MGGGGAQARRGEAGGDVAKYRATIRKAHLERLAVEHDVDHPVERAAEDRHRRAAGAGDQTSLRSPAARRVGGTRDRFTCCWPTTRCPSSSQLYPIVFEDVSKETALGTAGADTLTADRIMTNSPGTTGPWAFVLFGGYDTRRPPFAWSQPDMPATATQSLADRYTAAFPGSKKRFEEAKQLFPCGVTHDTRMMEPFPVYITHAKGAHKWDVDGHELIDYFVGHGSHLLGHSPGRRGRRPCRSRWRRARTPARATTWRSSGASWSSKLVPSAERVRFTGSGTEATLMALRLSRLFTGRPKFLKFQGHFHGWHDYVTGRGRPALRRDRACPACRTAVAAHCVAIPPNDLNRVEDALKTDPQIGAVILEPTGGHWGGGADPRRRS